MTDWPLVSCIMPTYNRRQFVPMALRCWLRQDYPGPRELIVIDDGEDAVGDLVLQTLKTGFDYERLVGRHPTGTKINHAVEYLAKGDFFALWADDDWYAPWRLRRQVEALLASGADVCCSDRCIYWDLLRQKAAMYHYVAGRASTAGMVGGTLVFTRRYWQEQPFEPVSLAEDQMFVQGRLGPRAAWIEPDCYVAMVHDSNVSGDRIRDLMAAGHEQFEPTGLPAVAELMGSDFVSYERLGMEAV